MAFRKRVYAGPSRMGRMKRMKFSVRRKTTSRRRPMAFRRDAMMVTNGLRGGGLGYTRRRFNPRAYRRRLWNDSAGEEHYRSALTGISTINTPAVRTQLSWYFLRMHDPSFYTVAGGAQPPISSSTTFAKNLIIRGGKATAKGINNSSVQLFVRVFVIRTILGGALPNSGAFNNGWDLTMVDSNKRDFRVYRSYDFTLDVGESFSVEHRLGVREYDITSSVFQYVWLWGFTVCNLKTDAAATLDLHTTHSMSFTGDVSVN